MNRMMWSLLIAVSLYMSLAVESVHAAPVVLPHGPAVLLALAMWWLSPTPALVLAALVGTGVDAIGTGPVGPGIVAAVLAVLCLGHLKRRWEWASPLSALIASIAVAAALLLGSPLIAQAVADGVAIDSHQTWLSAARAVASGMATLAVIVAARVMGRAGSGLAVVVLGR